MKCKAKKILSGKVGSIEFTIIKSDRKTLCIETHRELGIVVRAPIEMTKKEIVSWVRTKKSWISARQLEIQQKPVRKYVEGESFPFKGRDYPLHIILDENCNRFRVNIVDNKLTVYSNTGDREKLKDVIKKWYIENAKKQYFMRVRYFHKYICEPIKCIYVKDQKTLWGSCSSLRNLSFNWKGIMAPPEILDYIVVHEMCHLKHMDHSKEFWEAVEKILPDYKERKKWLKDNGRKLDL